MNHNVGNCLIRLVQEEEGMDMELVRVWGLSVRVYLEGRGT